MTIETEVLRALSGKPASGGALIERFQAEGGGLLRGRAALVYGALRNLQARGEVEPLAAGAGEVLWGRPGTVPPPPREPGPPPTFSLGPQELARIDRELGRATAGLPPHYFEELRRVVVADADRRAFHGATAGAAVAEALLDLGPRGGLRGFLRRTERGGRVRLRMRRPVPLRWAVAPLVLIGLALLLRLLVFGVYTIPDYSVSMAPTLFPAAEHGDALVLVSLLAYRFGEPRRGDVVALAWPDGRTLVKRLLGLPGETIGIRRGDLFVDGSRLVKERELLDRVKVPLLAQDEFERTAAGLRGVAHGGYRLPDGGVEGDALDCRDIVVTAGATLGGDAGSFTVTIGKDCLVALNERGGAVAAPGHGALDVDPRALRLDRGVRRAIWLTNADGVLRVELDGREVARAPVERGAARAIVTVVVDGDVRLDGLELARDLVHDGSGSWALGADDVFLLGDNSADSQDSRSFGPVPLDRLRGKVLGVAWPPSRMRLVD